MLTSLKDPLAVTPLRFCKDVSCHEMPSLGDVVMDTTEASDFLREMANTVLSVDPFVTTQEMLISVVPYSTVVFAISI